MSSPKVTYLFGAGASARVLPTIKELPDRILSVMDFLKEQCQYTIEEKVPDNQEVLRAPAMSMLLDDLSWLAQHAKGHTTVDTYAKQLYLNSQYEEVEKLVWALGLYFNVEQKLSGIDPRYITFLISILQSHTYSFPENVKFLSWNYNLQLEGAHAQILNYDGSDVNKGLFNTDDYDMSSEKFTSVKLNGSCNYRQDRSFYPMIKGIGRTNIQDSDFDLPLKVTYSKRKLRKDIYPGNVDIRFAWYRDPTFVKKVAEIYSNTEVLVVIGYSFPFFNREVDRAIIRAMAGLRNIYVQDINADFVAEKFTSILSDLDTRNIKIKPIKDVNEFFLPPDL